MGIGIFESSTLRKYLRGVSSNNLNIQFEECEAPYRNGETIVFPTPNANTTAEDAARMRSYAAVQAELAKQEALYIPDKVESVIHRNLEAFRAKKTVAGMYSGDKQSLLTSTPPMLHEYVQRVGMQQMSGSPEEQAVLHSVHMRYQAESDMFPGMRSDVQALGGMLDPDKVAKLQDAGIPDKLDAIDSPTDSLSLTREIIELLKDDEESEGEDGEGEGEGEGESGEQSPSEGQPQDGDQQEGEGQPDQSLADLLPEEVSSDKNQRESDQQYGYSVPPRTHNDEAMEASTVIITGENLSLLGRTSESRMVYSFQKALDEAEAHNSGLSGSVRRLIEIMSQTSVSRCEKSGRIDRGKLYRAGVPTVGDGTWNKQVWTKSSPGISTQDSAICVLVDFSGSMYGDKLEQASATAAILSHTIGKALGVPLEILGFTDGYGDSYLLEFKLFNEVVSRDTMLERFAGGSHYCSANCDGLYVMMASQRLMQRPEKNKVLIVLSDGEPAGSLALDPHQHLRDVLAEVDKYTPIEVHSIGIQSKSVKRYYKNYSVVKSSTELEGALLELIQQRILK